MNPAKYYKGILPMFLLVASASTRAACLPNTILVVGQSNAVELIENADLPKIFGSINCPAQIIISAYRQRAVDFFMPSGAYYQRSVVKAGKNKVKAILYLQGEEDSRTLLNTTKWLPKVSYLLGSYQAAIGTLTTPIVVWQLNSFYKDPKYQYWQVIRQSQAKLAALPNMRILDSSPYQFRDGVHLVASEYTKLARDMAALAR
ncbi:exported hypothetical protein [Crenothrix polyspora]|jgi:hypothetical protein|uniref:Sialate O-acetylesterase domain-containing protein n=1 Tax=Crenothrix polyspora TaxID=360316 RepID=A0A1R4HAG6_9GAMM|nr:sialate O-acetylesterase [Crenothrix polyspora]SJM93166.1 exported hypothetical protein [Crenothrix polyspora]